MKVFGCRMHGGYRGGVILVAANDVREAYITATKQATLEWMFEYCDEDGNWIDPDTRPDLVPKCDYYPIEEWHEYEHLSTDFTEPQVILEESYAE